jgi:hypothetical protein
LGRPGEGGGGEEKAKEGKGEGEGLGRLVRPSRERSKGWETEGNQKLEVDVSQKRCGNDARRIYTQSITTL